MSADEVAKTHHNLGECLARQEKYEAAEAEHRLALELREKAQGAGHVDVAASQGALAHVLAEQGRLAEAEPLYEEAIATRAKIMGAEHPLTVVLREGLEEARRAGARVQKSKRARGLPSR